MATRFGIVAIKDALVTLLGTTAASDLNSGLSRDVQQVITIRPEELVVADTKFPTVNVWMGNSTDEFRGASKRKEVRQICEIHAYVKKWGSVDNSIDDAQRLADNIRYIIDGNTGLAAVSPGWIKTSGVTFDYGMRDSGFITKAVINIEIVRELN